MLSQNGNKTFTFHFQLNNYFQNGKIHHFFHFNFKIDTKCFVFVLDMTLNCFFIIPKHLRYKTVWNNSRGRLKK
nr:MAG TPA: hypothetical protein [Caudoviricetes sp.]